SAAVRYTVGRIMVDITIGFRHIRAYGPSMAAWGQTASCELGLLAAARRECIERRRSLLVRGVSRSGILVTPHQPRRMTMEIQEQVMSSTPRREPWNKGMLIGQKPPLRPKHVWSIRTRLQRT